MAGPAGDVEDRLRYPFEVHLPGETVLAILGLLLASAASCRPEAGGAGSSSAAAAPADRVAPPQAVPASRSRRSKEELLTEGMIRMKQGQPFMAVEAFRKALLNQPDDPVVMFHLGRALQKSTKLSEAEKVYRNVVQRQPGMAEAWLHLSEIYIRQGRFQEALDVLERLQAVHGRGPHLDYQQGFVLSHLGKYEEANEKLRQSLATEPRNADAWYVLGLNAQRQGRDEEAEKAFRSAIRVDPAYADAWFNLGNVLARLHHPDQAEEALQRFAAVKEAQEQREAEESNRKSLSVGLQMNIRNGDLPGAVRQLQEAESRWPGSALALRLRGEVLLAQGQKQAALKYLRNAAALNSTEPGEQLSLADAFRRAGDRIAASRQDQIALRLMLAGGKGS
ncbi:MAG: tetratricopeptide repeat protein [Acidobacteriota bacterium]